MINEKDVENFCRNLAKEYFYNRNFELVEKMADERITVIGTGGHEISCNINQLKIALEKEAKQWDGRFLIEKQWYQVIDLNNDLYLVIGEISAKQDSDSLLKYHFTSRITLVIEYQNNSFKIIHFHQSIADPSQGDDEYFPHRLLEESKVQLAKQIKEKTKQLEIANEQVIYDLQHDYLTGIFNRNYFEKKLKRILKQTDYGIFMLVDIDYFKHVNDQYGHLYGDQILKLLSKLMKEDLGVQNCGRIGGDEFVAFLENANNDFSELNKKIIIFKEHWEKSIKKLNLPQPISISIGIAYYPSHGTTIVQLLQKADSALYKSKNSGRNLITIYQ